VIKITTHIADPNLKWIIQHLLVLVMFSNTYYNVTLKKLNNFSSQRKNSTFIVDSKKHP